MDTIQSFYYFKEITNPLTLFMIELSGFLIYFLPSIIAVYRKHNNKIPIIVLNLFLGWTFFGWVIALVWGLTDNVRK